MTVPWEELESVLGRAKVREAFRQLSKRWFDRYLNEEPLSADRPHTPDRYTLEGWEWSGTDMGEAGWANPNDWVHRNDEVRGILDRLIWDDLSHPARFTMEDIEESAVKCLSVVSDHFELAYDRFIDSCKSHLNSMGQHTSVDLTGIVNVFSPAVPLNQIAYDQNGLSVTIIRSEDPEYSTDANPVGGGILTRTLIAQVDFDYWSKRAAETVLNQIELLLQSATRSLVESYQFSEEPIIGSKTLTDTDIEAQSTLPLVSQKNKIPIYGPLRSDQKGWNLLGIQIAAFLSPPPRRRKGPKDTFHRRIHNAVALLMQADSVKDEMIAMTLCVAAVEAMLGDDGESKISDTVARRCATLLQPDGERRKSAYKNVKTLYDMRSRLIHGVSLENQTGAMMNSRRLASGVLKALLELALFQGKTYGLIEMKEITEYLKTADFSGKPVHGVPEILSGCLPNEGDGV